MVICQHFSWLSSRKVWVKNQLKLLALALEHPCREWNRASLYLAWRIQEQRWWQPSYYKRLPPENHCLCTTRGKKATSIHKLIENKSQTLTFVQQLHRIFITTAMSGDLWHPPVFSANEPISSKPSLISSWAIKQALLTSVSMRGKRRLTVYERKRKEAEGLQQDRCWGQPCAAHCTSDHEGRLCSSAGIVFEGADFYSKDNIGFWTALILSLLKMHLQSQLLKN